MFFVSEIQTSAPEQFRTPLQEKTYRALAELGIPFERVDTDEAITMDDCVQIDAKLQMKMVKTLFLCDRKQTAFYLLITAGDKPFSSKNFSTALGVPRVSFAPSEKMQAMLTGAFSTDVSDASGTLLFDVAHKCWSPRMLELCGIRADQLPKIYESAAPVGVVKKDAAAQLGLPENVVVCAGAGDNAAAAVGCGVVGPGKCNISLGTSGTVFITSDSFGVDQKNALHSFAHADGGWHLMSTGTSTTVRIRAFR